MSLVRTFSRAFSGGEVTPELFGLIDDSVYQRGLKQARNFITRPHGPAETRPGTQYVRTAGAPSTAVWLIPFEYAANQNVVLEVGDLYMRFHADGGTLLAPAATAWSNATAYTVGNLASRLGVTYYCKAPNTNQQPPNATYWHPQPASGEYEIPTPYAAGDLSTIKTDQSNDVLTLTHPSYAVRELRRYGATDWRLELVAFATSLAAPGSVAAIATSTGGTLVDCTYVVTALSEDGTEESLASASATCSNNLQAVGAYNTITWAAVTGASRYNVYAESNGLFGYIGQTEALTFKDDNITPDVAVTPPEAYDPFTSAGNYPATVGYIDQRRAFAGTNNQPQQIWATRSGTEKNLTFSIPTRDDDSLSFRIAARANNAIRHMIALDDLVLLTAAAAWKVGSVDGGALTTLNVRARPQSYVGASHAPPVVAGGDILYSAEKGAHYMRLAYEDNTSRLRATDLSRRAPHLFDGYRIADADMAESPYPTVWLVRNDGKMLGLTYDFDNQVVAWHTHDTDGEFESVAVVPEDGEDAVYVVVRRTVDGSSTRYIERLASRRFDADEDAFCVDAGVTYSGAAATTITGLDHLEGKTVSIVSGGAVRPRAVVTGGAVTLDQMTEAGAKTHIGLPYTCRAETLPMAFDVPGFGLGRPKNINQVWLRVYRSGGVFVGPAFDMLTEAKIRTSEPYGSPPTLLTGVIDLTLENAWQDDGIVCIEQSDPLPLTLVSLSAEASIGG